jgi:hypothetical protein
LPIADFQLPIWEPVFGAGHLKKWAIGNRKSAMNLNRQSAMEKKGV